MGGHQIKNKHLVVLIHGLWGSYKHMKSMKTVFNEKFGKVREIGDYLNNIEETIFFAPKQNALFKTFDGIEIIGYRTLIELCHFIEQFHKRNKDARITKVSVVGYSLGGLVARFVIGKCFTEFKDFFKNIEPFVFMTVASPHLGIQFYEKSRFNSWILNPIKKILGSTFLGKSGRELFIIDSGNNEPMLVRLSQNEYLYALSLFKHRIVMANVKNDRTVAFYTAFITDRDPFIESGNTLKYFFEKNIPMENSYNSIVLPRILDLNRLNFKDKAPTRDEKTSFKIWILYKLVVPILIIFFIPIAIVFNTFGSIYSYMGTLRYRKMLREDGRLPTYVKERVGISDTLHDFVGDTYDSIINESAEQSKYVNANEDDLTFHRSQNAFILQDEEDADSKDNNNNSNTNSNNSSSDLQSLLKKVSNMTPNDIEMWGEFVDKYSHNMDPNEDWLKTFHKLPLDKNRTTILQNLSKLDWIRIPIYVKSINAHGGVIARRGLNENTPPTGYAALEFLGGLIRYFLETNDN